MTRIGVLSDTHSFIDEKILNHLKDCDVIWHAGDIGNWSVIEKLGEIAPVQAVYGNIDDHKTRISAREDNLFIAEDMKVLMTHIAGYPGRYYPRVRKMIQEKRPDIVVAGHSHILKIIYDKKYEHLHINPGAAGKSGFHKVRTLVRFNLDGKKLSNMEVVEIKR